MASLINGFEYDVFISYRQKDNKGERWVSEFVDSLKTELEATFKEDISIYFDENPHDGLLETHDVEDSLREKLKCVVFIPVLSRTYCDPNSYAWNNEFRAFIEQASNDQFGLKVRLPNRNVASRILPVRIHELSTPDQALFEETSGCVLRCIDFIYKSPGVNRPLRMKEDHPQDNVNKVYYRDQVNKVANAIEEIIGSLKGPQDFEGGEKGEKGDYVSHEVSTSDIDTGKIDLQTGLQSLADHGRKEKSDVHISVKFPLSKLKKYIYTVLVIAPLIILVINWKGITRIIGPGGAKREKARIHAINAKDYCDNNQLDAAKREVALALDIEPENSAALTTLAAISIKEGDLNTAIKQTLEALSADPSNKQAAYNLAYAFDDKQDYPQAIEWYSKAIKIDSTFVQAYSALGHLYNSIDQPADAVLILKMAMNKYPGSEYLYLIQKNLGIAYYIEDIYDDAIKYLELSLDTHPDLPETNLYLARAYEAAGMMTKSIDTWQKYINVETDTLKAGEAEKHMNEITVKYLERLQK
jgi:tetratricopeptide (TPR) repeat protein